MLNFLKFTFSGSAMALLVGFGVEQLRETPLPLVYKSSESMIETSNQSSVQDTPNAPINEENNTTEAPQIETIRLKEFLEYQKKDKTVIIDARSSLFYRMGHIPKAINLSRKNYNTEINAFYEQYFKHNDVIRIIVYCAGEDCHDSHVVAKGLQSLGFNQVMVFAGGWSEWEEHQKHTK